MSFKFLASRSNRMYQRFYLRYYSSLEETRKVLGSVGGGAVHLIQEEETGIARICLDHIEKKNAISGTMMVQLEDAIHKLELWDMGKAVILESAGDVFCSGGDLSSLQKVPSSLFCPYMHQILLRFYSLPMVSVAVIQGPALGGGAELSAVTDYRIFSSKGQVQFVQGIMGLIPGWGGGVWLSNHLGRAVAMDLLLSSKKLSAEEAVKIGFAAAIFSHDNIYNDAKEWLKQKVRHHHTVIRGIKSSFTKYQIKYLEESLLNEKEEFLKLWGGPANKEALDKKIKHK